MPSHTQISAASRLLVLVLLAATMLPADRAIAQGDLNPPGAPAPTMKTLDEVEAKLEKRTPISSLPFTISSPGSYYLTRNLVGAAGQHGITIAERDVNLDLNGFRLSGVNGSLNGINVPAQVQNVVIRNGFVIAWSGSGIGGAAMVNGRIEKIHATNNGGSPHAGIITGERCVVVDCVASTTYDGIRVGNNSQVINSTASNNGHHGIEAGEFSTVASCAATANDTYGITVGPGSAVSNSQVGRGSSRGINAGSGSRISNCTVRATATYGIYTDAASLVTGCLVTGSGTDFPSAAGIGIRVGDESTVSQSTARGNKGDGIQATTDCLVTDNVVSANGTVASPQNGIHLFGTRNRVESNQVRSNIGTGILSNGGAGADIVVRNTSGNNTTNYNPSSGATFGPLQTPATAGVSPWANF